MKQSMKAYRERMMRVCDRLDARMRDGLGRSRIKVAGDRELSVQAAREVRVLRLNSKDAPTPIIRLGAWWDA